MPTTLDLSTDYLKRGVTSPGAIVELVLRLKTQNNLTFDTILGTGMSGAIIVPLVGRALELNWGLVRKPSENDHSSNPIEGTLGERWLFLDDLVSSGTTRMRVMETVKHVCKIHGHTSKFEGTITYDPPLYLDYGREL